jgi:hypothetical protein
MHKSISAVLVAAAMLAASGAIAACGSTSANSSRSSRAGRQPTGAQLQQDMVEFSACMRSHGVVNFPDPSSPRAFKSALDPDSQEAQSPQFHSGAVTCHHLLPTEGTSSQSPARTHAQVAAALAFAQCMRGHGFRSFPDPTSSGDLSHAMLANAGINVHQPAAAQAADACTSVTHGLITRAMVARFIAGD